MKMPHTGRGKKHRQKGLPLKIIYPWMDYSADCLYRVKLEAPIMEGY